MDVRSLAMLTIVVLGGALLLAPASTAAASIGLGSAANFAVLAGAGITNTGETSITGDVGSHPTASQTGFETVTLTGTNHFDSEVTALAKDALVTAYDEANDLPPDALVGELGGLTLAPGVYADNNAPNSMSLIGTLTLDGMNLTDPVFVFQSDSTLVLGSGATVLLINGATSCNVFWQVGSSATLGTGSHLEGTIMALDSISMTAGATVDGRVLARNGSVTMINNTITNLPCQTTTTTTTGTSTSTSTTPPPTSTSTSTTPPPTSTSTSTTPPPTSTSTSTTPPLTSTSTSTTPPPTSTSTSTTPPLTSTSTSTTPPPTSTSTNTTPPPSTEIPVFPTPLAGILAAVGAIGASFLMVRRRL